MIPARMVLTSGAAGVVEGRLAQAPQATPALMRLMHTLEPADEA